MTERPHALYFLPLPQGQRSLRPTRVSLHTGWAVASRSLSLVSTLLDSASEAGSWNGAAVSSAGVCGRLCRNCLQAIRLKAQRKRLWQISDWMLTIRASKSLKAWALYSMSGSRWP